MGTCFHLRATLRSHDEVFTARSGRIDSSGEQSELVLTDVLATKFPSSKRKHAAEAPATTLPPVASDQKSYVVERSDQLRFSINTGRADIVQRLNQRDMNADSMDWTDLRERVDIRNTSTTKGSDQNPQSPSRSFSCAVFLCVHGSDTRITNTARRPQRWRAADADRRHCLLPDLAARRIAGARRHRLALRWTMARDGLHLRSEPVVSVRQSTSIHIFRIDLVAAIESHLKPATATRQTTHRGFSSVRFSKPDGCDAVSLAGAEFLVCFIALAAIFNIFTLFELWRFIAVTHAGAGLVAQISAVSAAADHRRTLSRDDADLGAGHLCVAGEKT